MTDAVQIAYERRKDYKASIARLEREIEELGELVKDLDSFIEFGEALVGKDSLKVKSITRPIVAELNPVDEDDVDPADEWATDKEDDAKDPVSRTISQRVG